METIHSRSWRPTSRRASSRTGTRSRKRWRRRAGACGRCPFTFPPPVGSSRGWPTSSDASAWTAPTMTGRTALPCPLRRSSSTLAAPRGLSRPHRSDPSAQGRGEPGRRPASCPLSPKMVRLQVPGGGEGRRHRAMTAHSGRVGLTSELTSRGGVDHRRDARRELEDEPDGGALLGRGDR